MFFSPKSVRKHPVEQAARLLSSGSRQRCLNGPGSGGETGPRARTGLEARTTRVKGLATLDRCGEATLTLVDASHQFAECRVIRVKLEGCSRGKLRAA